MLTAAQVAAFERDGFLIGLPALSAAQAAALRRHLGQRPAAERLLRALAGHPAVVAAAQGLLGPDVLLRNIDVFIKGPRSGQSTDWHVDTDTPPAPAAALLNVWIALTDSTPEGGCLEYLPGHHRRPLPEEPQSRADLTLSAQARMALALPAGAVAGPLSVGQMALHAARTPHRSGPNRTDTPRIGAVLRLLSARASPEAAGCGQAVLLVGHPRDWAGRLHHEATVGWNIQLREAAPA